MVLFWELKFFDLMVRHHAGVVSGNNKRGWNFANSHTLNVMFLYMYVGRNIDMSVSISFQCVILFDF